MNFSMRRRMVVSGRRPRAAPRLSTTYSALAMPGTAQVTAGCETRYFRKNWAQVLQSNSAAHSGSFFPCTALNKRPRPKGKLIIAGIPGEGQVLTGCCPNVARITEVESFELGQAI